MNIDPAFDDHVARLTDENERLAVQIVQLNARIDLLADGVLRLEAERDAWQQLALAHGASDASPTSTMLLQQERAAFHARMREMGIAVQEDDHA